MKRKLIIFTLCVLLPATLTACSKKSADAPAAVTSDATEQNSQDSAAATEAAEETRVYDDSLITEAYSIEKEITFDSGTDYEHKEYFTYHIPQLSDETEDAKAINQKILDLYEDMAKSLETADENYDESISGVSYQTIWNDSLLSLVIEAAYMYSDIVEYEVFNYDFQSGTVVTNADLIEMAGMSEEEYIKTLRYAAAVEADKTTDEMSVMQEEAYGEDLTDEMLQLWNAEAIHLRAKTISDQYINMDTPLYMNANGNLEAIARIGVMAGSGWYYQNIEIKKGEKIPEDLNGKNGSLSMNDEGAIVFNQALFHLQGEEGYQTSEQDREYYIGIDASNGDFLYQDYTADGEDNLNLSGSITYIGMNEKGLIFSFVLDEQDGKAISEKDQKKGTFLMVVTSDENDDYDKLTICPLEGTDLFDAGEQGETVLERTFG